MTLSFEDILRNVSVVLCPWRSLGGQCCLVINLLKIPSFVFCRINGVIQIWNGMGE